MTTSGEGGGGGIVRATLSPVSDDRGTALSDQAKRAAAVAVHFNPEKLDITLTNNFKKSTGDNPVQLVDDATAQLAVELIFDTTPTGIDVRQDTGRIAAFLRPLDVRVRADRRRRLPPPKVVEFEWGAIVFQGYITSYTESLDFFSHDGVPLRAKVNLALTQQERSFEPRSDPASGEAGPFATAGTAADPFAGNVAEMAAAPDQPIDNATAAANGIENPRLPGAAVLAPPSASGLGRPPAAFATAGAGFGASAGAGAGFGLSAGASAGIGLSGGVNAGIGASASAGIGVSSGASAGMGLSAGASAGGGTAAAFAGLSVKPPRVQPPTPSVTPPTFQASAGTGAVQLGGQVKAQAGASLATDVGGRRRLDVFGE
ncbi:MAG: hypothetical protein EA356_12855 [Geminicoccaceae bacterium]|nr:MAG: hypothetical protein EA356_12855 [Geminicoccaceae bacterium]